MRDRDRFEDIVRKNLDVRASDRTYTRIRDTVLDAHGPAKTTESVETPILKGRTIMRNPIAKLAVAAAILFAIGLGVYAFISTGSHSGVVWAQVADQMDASRGFIYQMRQTQTRTDLDRPIEIRMINYECPGHGGRTEGYDGDRLISNGYYSYDEGVQVMLLHTVKRYTQRTLPSLPPGAEASVEGGAAPKAMVRQFTAGDYKKLGRRTIAGVEAEGIEVQNPLGFMGNFQVDSHTAQLWVSVETGYPVLIESEIVGNNGTIQIKMIMDEFQWDVELDPSEFHAVIPPDYQPLEIRETENGAVVEGRYPGGQ
jgi:hypothetical protein